MPHISLFLVAFSIAIATVEPVKATDNLLSNIPVTVSLLVLVVLGTVLRLCST